MKNIVQIYTNHPGGILVHKHNTIKFDVVGERPATKYYPNQLKRLKRVEKLHRLKLQSIFSEASQTEWREPFDFPTGNSGFPCKWEVPPLSEKRSQGGGGGEGEETVGVQFVETQPKKHIRCLITRLTLVSRIFSGLSLLLQTAVWAEENTKTKTKQGLA